MRSSIYCDFDGEVITAQVITVRNCMSCLDKFGDVNAMSRMSVLPVYLSRCVCSSVFK